MVSPELVLAPVVLAAAVGLGTVAHEFLHAGCLGAAGVPFEIQWGDDGAGRFGGAFGALASVTLQRVPPDLAAWQLRVAALSPFVLAAPLLAIAAGVVPDPFAGDDLLVQLALVGWVACALPSPQDFSLFWHAEEIVATRGLPGEWTEF